MGGGPFQSRKKVQGNEPRLCGGRSCGRPERRWPKRWVWSSSDEAGLLWVGGDKTVLTGRSHVVGSLDNGAQDSRVRAVAYEPPLGEGQSPKESQRVAKTFPPTRNFADALNRSCSSRTTLRTSRTINSTISAQPP